MEGAWSPAATASDGKLFTRAEENSCARARFTQIVILPNTHVPVVVCRSAGIWTRGQLTVLGRPAAGGEPANPAKRGTRLEATTDRAFLVSAGPPKVGAQRGLSILPGVRTGDFLVQTMALIARGYVPEARLGHGVAADRSSGPSMAFLKARRRIRAAVASAGQRLRVASPTREREVASPESFMFPGAEETSARLGDGAHD